MNLLEHQGKQLFEKYAIPIPKGRLINTPQGAKEVASILSSEVVLKAQVYAGGRGKAGGIRFAETPLAAEIEAMSLLGQRIKGIEVKSLWVEQRLSVQKEFYVGITVDYQLGKPILLFISGGGIDVEELAQRSSPDVHRLILHPVSGVFPHQIRSFVYQKFPNREIASHLVPILESLIKMFIERDLLLVEINPLVLTKEGTLVAADSKIVVDDNALFRQPEMRVLEEDSSDDPIEREASKRGFCFVRLDGKIGTVTHGAGVGMLTIDTIRKKGGSPANFLDIKGHDRAKNREQERRVKNELDLVFSNPQIKAVLFNTFAGIGRCDEIARGIRKYVEEHNLPVPMVVRFAGTNAKAGYEILTGLPLILVQSFEKAVETVVELERG